MEVLVFANPNDPAKERFFHEISRVPKLSPRFVLEPDCFLMLLKKTKSIGMINELSEAMKQGKGERCFRENPE